MIPLKSQSKTLAFSIIAAYKKDNQITMAIDVNELNCTSFLSETKTRLRIKIDTRKISVLALPSGL